MNPIASNSFVVGRFAFAGYRLPDGDLLSDFFVSSVREHGYMVYLTFTTLLWSPFFFWR